ncbi:MAG: DUF2339 domain-containing protein, partial [Candidatus Omnitrophica bacterium]|nr:DUF2339 domain-containing protein [Candidatus Omnitrophota bacterium]
YNDFFFSTAYATASKITNVSLVAASFFVIGILANRSFIADIVPEMERQVAKWIYPWVGSFLFVMLIADITSSQWLSLGWTLLGSLILGAGFFLNQRSFRISGLVILSLTSIRVVLHDMSGVNTIYKITACIALGLILLGISMIYTKFKEDQ